MPKVAPEKYVMPAPGAVVLFRHAASDVPSHAIVTGVGERSIDCNVVVPGAMSLLIKNAVRHVEDPERDRFVAYSDGFWDLLPGEQQVRDLVASFPDFLSRLEDVERGMAAMYDAAK